MWLICGTTGGDGAFGVAVVGITPARVAEWQAIVEAARVAREQCGRLYRLEAWSDHCDFGTSWQDGNEVEDISEDGGWRVSHTDPQLVGDREVCATTVSVTDTGVLWQAMFKHGAGCVETAELPFALLAELAAGRCPFLPVGVQRVSSPDESPRRSPDDVKILVIGDRVWGRGETVDEARRQCKRINKKLPTRYIVYIATADVYIDDTGAICSPHGAYYREICRIGVPKGK